MRLRVRDICDFALTTEDGQTVYGYIAPALQKKEVVELDFQGVKGFASVFFNASIGQLLRDLKREDVKRLLKIENLPADGHEIVRQVIDNAEKYYASPEECRAAQRRVLEAMAEQM